MYFSVRSQANLHFDRENVEQRQKTLNDTYGRLCQLSAVSGLIFVLISVHHVIFPWKEPVFLLRTCSFSYDGCLSFRLADGTWKMPYLSSDFQENVIVLSLG